MCVYRYQYRLRCIRVLVCEDMHVCVRVCWIESDRIEAGAIEISVVLYKWSTCSYTHAHTYTHTRTYHTCVPTLSQCVHHVFCLFRLYL